MDKLLERIAGTRTAVAAGLIWLLGLWLLVGSQINSALGDDCGALTSDACRAEQSVVVQLFVQAFDAVGRPGQLAALLFAASLFGNLVNFGAAFALTLRWENAAPLLMGWARDDEFKLSNTAPEKAREAAKLRAEGMAAFQFAIPLAVLVAILGFKHSFLWLAALLGPAALLLLSYLVMVRHRDFFS